MNRTLAAPFGAPALARPTRTSQKVGVFRRWFAGIAAARERQAAEVVLRRLVEHIPHASASERSRLEALADDLRRRLG
jgi:hypothetical protein